MTLVSPRRGISAALAVLVSAIFIMPSGTAFADEQNTPHPTEIETHSTLPLDSTVEEEPVADDVVQTPEPVDNEPAATKAPQPSASSRVVESTKTTSDESIEKTSPNALATTGRALVCEPGYLYSIRGNGDVYQIKPGDNQTRDTERQGTMGTGSSNYNGIGIGASGGPVYAYQRTQSGNSTTNARIMRWDGAGTTAQQVASTSIKLNGSLVAGSVDLTASSKGCSMDRLAHLLPNNSPRKSVTQVLLWHFKVLRFLGQDSRR